MRTIRSAAEALLRPLVYWRRLPREFGGVPILVSPSARLGFAFKSMAKVDPPLLSLVSDQVSRDAIVWDVGANIGLFSVAAAHRAGSGGLVVAVEPDAWLVQALRRTAKAQPPSSAAIKVVPAAVASSVSLREFHIAKRSRATSYLAGYGSTQTGGSLETQTVIAITLDWLAVHYPAPTVLKIDVEGAELEALQGAATLIEQARPTVLCEVSSADREAVTAFFHGRQYQLYDGETPSAQRQVVAQATWSTIAVPA